MLANWEADYVHMTYFKDDGAPVSFAKTVVCIVG
jgi:hypothetical protein